MSELWQRTATELASAIRSGQASSREVVAAHLARIQAVNGRVNAVTVALEESALAAADRVDAGETKGPLAGVPFTIKENIDCMGSATTQGLPAMAASMPTHNSPVVERMIAAGAIPLARTNLPEMGLRITTDNPLHGRTNNPWDPSRTAGGSSGGEAAALATGMSCIGLGNDIGGSLRNPAYCCGITSLKPTTGRIPLALSLAPADVPIGFRMMAVEGPMSRSVADLKLALELLAGFHPRDPVSTPAAVPGPPVTKKAGLVTALPGVEMPPSTVAAIERAGDALRDAGWEIDAGFGVPELERVNEMWARVLGFDLEVMLPMLTEVMSKPALGLLDQLLSLYPTQQMPSPAVWIERDRLSKAWSAMFEACPVVIGPTWADLPFLHDADLDPQTGVDTTLARLTFITPGNLLGLPAVCVPMGEADGLPTGVQVYAERWREDVCLDVAAIIEQAAGAPLPIDPL